MYTIGVIATVIASLIAIFVFTMVVCMKIWPMDKDTEDLINRM